MSDTKPPMTVWLNDDTCTAFEYGLRGVCRGSKDNVHDVGPYVHLEQFLEEVERRAWLNPKIRSWDMSLDEAKAEAIREIAKEITEGES